MIVSPRLLKAEQNAPGGGYRTAFNKLGDTYDVLCRTSALYLSS